MICVLNINNPLRTLRYVTLAVADPGFPRQEGTLTPKGANAGNCMDFGMWRDRFPSALNVANVPYSSLPEFP